LGQRIAARRKLPTITMYPNPFAMPIAAGGRIRQLHLSLAPAKSGI